MRATLICFSDMQGKLTTTLLFSFLLCSCAGGESEEPSFYVKLATLEYGESPTASQVSTLQRALEKLHQKCPGDDLERLGNHAYFLKKKLAEKGHSQTILASITAIEHSIPDGQTVSTCAEIAAALIVLSEG